MKFGSVCSGIEAASVAWHPLGWKAAWFAEIEPFPCAVLAHHYPEVPNLGDFTAIARAVLTGEVEAPEMLCGGTPCQAFSVAGLRESLADDRGNLTLKFVELADAIDHVRTARGDQPAVVFWENVHGVLSTADNAFGCFLAGLAGEDEPLQPAGEKWSNAGAVYGPARTVAWRTLDAQYFGVAQRRRRVFVVASARNDFDPAAVLFEWHSLRRDTAPGRKTGQGTAGTLTRGAFDGSPCGGDGRDAQLITMAHGQGGAEIGFDRGPTLTCNHEAPIAVYPDTTHTLRGEGFDASDDGTGRGTPLVPVAGAICRDSFSGGMGGRPEGAAAGHVLPVAFHPSQDPISSTDLCHCIGANENSAAVAFQSSQSGVRLGYTHATLDAHNGPRRHNGVVQAMQVRRLTPRECERLQGFPDDYTAIPWRTYQEAARKGASYEGLLQSRGMTLRGPSLEECPDGPRYKALGNSWAVPNVRWIGRRIAAALAAAERKAA